MAKDTKNGGRLSGSSNDSYDFSLDETIAFSGSGERRQASVDDAVIDEILRSISDQSDTPVPPRSTASRTTAAQTSAPRQTASRTTRAATNSYAEAAAHAHQEQQGTRPISPVSQRSTGPIPDPSYYSMRDPAQTQSFQPARPAHRDTDRLPTLVDEKPIRRKSAVGKVLTFLVMVLVIIALVLGIRMAYILGPSLGWNLPDLTELPVVSQIISLLPSTEDTTSDTSDSSDVTVTSTDDTSDTTESTETPTTLTLDQSEISLEEGGVAIITATTDVENWSGTVVWASSDETVATVTSIGDNIAQVNYVGEGSCSIAAVASVGTQTSPSASCRVTCGAGTTTTDTTTETTDTTDTTAEAVDVTLNREDFTLNVGESHQLMDENADQCTWTSSDESVATVNSNGVVTAVGAGSCTITATASDGTSASAVARVK